jgi:sterol desaturase/sphingolipid hydroxylase (fatty acid hydroxylase superfamily)
MEPPSRTATSRESATSEGSQPPALGGPRTPREALPAFLRNPSPRLLVSALALALCARLALGGWSAWDLAPPAALLVLWPLQEWLIHVIVLHWKPRRLLGRELDFVLSRKHREHHADPADLALVFIPFHSYAYTLPLLVLLWLALTPNLALALTGICAYLALALHYEWVHFLVHTRWRPRWRPYRALWQNHRLHHFRNERYWYGVTRRGADRLLGTGPDPGEVPASATCRTLGLAPLQADGARDT